MRIAVLVVPVMLGACYVAHYQNVSGPFVGTRVTVSCLDVAVTLTQDELAPDPVVSYEFGNSCFHETIVDFSAVHVVATTADGQQVPLSAFDPRGEIKPLQLDALTSGDERIAYRASNPVAMTSVCVDLGGLDAKYPTDPQWRCFGTGGAR
jgi:hypothetical protein